MSGQDAMCGQKLVTHGTRIRDKLPTAKRKITLLVVIKS